MSISFFSDIVTTSAPPVAGLLAQPAAMTAPQATAASTIRRPTGVVIAYLSGVGRPSLEAPRQGAKFPPAPHRRHERQRGAVAPRLHTRQRICVSRARTSFGTG